MDVARHRHRRVSLNLLQLGQSGYFAAFNNCLDNAVHVADAYGVRVWSWARHLPSLINVDIAPKGFFFSTLHELTHRPVVCVATG